MPTAAQLSAKLSKKRLAELLAEACLENETLAHRLEIELLGDQAQGIAAQLERRIDRFSGRQWETLPRYARHFETEHPLAATLLYRKLLENTLDNARSKAYGHAARYWRALAELAPRIQFPETIENETAYKARLSERHKRKTSFWKAMDQR